MPIDITIRKQKIKVIASDAQKALQIRKQLNDSLQYDLISALERAFADDISTNDYITIDRLEIDLGKITPDVFNQHFTILVESKLKQELEKLKAKSVLHTNENPSFTANSEQEQEITALLYFLEFGNFPWWHRKRKIISAATMLEEFTGERMQSLILKLMNLQKQKNIETFKRITERFFNNLSANQHETIVKQTAELYNNPYLVKTVSTIIENREELTELFSIPHQKFFEQLFRRIILNNEEKKFLQHFISSIKEESNLSNKDLKQKLQKMNSALSEGIKVADIAGKDSTIKKDVFKSFDKTVEEGIYITNAGLVLLLPFLPSFFQQLGFLNEQHRFVSVASQQKAVVTLYYLQCGDDDYKEWEMPFNKIACGLSPEEVFPNNTLIEEAEKEECKILMQSLVDYWDALKGASIEAVQNTFILREGKMSWKEDHWLLQVERTGVDILLDKLPWSFSTIKLPWLDHLIYTEW